MLSFRVNQDDCRGHFPLRAAQCPVQMGSKTIFLYLKFAIGVGAFWLNFVHEFAGAFSHSLLRLRRDIFGYVVVLTRFRISLPSCWLEGNTI